MTTSNFRRSMAANSIVRGQIWPNFELIQALMYIIITCKYEKDLIKTAKKKWQRRFPHYKSMGVFFRLSRADNTIVGGPIWLNFELLLDVMRVLNTYKFKMHPLNSNREKVATSILYTLKGSLLCSPWSDLAEF